MIVCCLQKPGVVLALLEVIVDVFLADDWTVSEVYEIGDWWEVVT